MSEGDAPAAFTRGSRARASLPAVKSSNHTKDRSLGVLYLQYGEETKQILMPNEVTTVDTVRALFVSAFPQQLTLKMLETPSVAIYIKDHVRNVYYELTDIRNITSHSCLKLYHKDPAQAFNHTSRSNNGDARISRERLYGTRQSASGQSMVHTLPNPHSPIRTVQGSMSPPAARSMPSSPSRLPYGSRSVTSSTLPRERLSSAPPARSITPCSSAILERRDVKPDEDVGPTPYGQTEARLSLASSQDAPDGAVFIQHRYSETTDAPQHSLYRQKSRKYSENQHAVPLGPKTPPPSPHRVGEVRMIDIHPGQNAHMMAQAVERVSPVRRSFRKDSNGTVEAGARVRGNMGSPVFSDLPPVHGDRPFQGLTTDPQSERMKAMEQQIASLTGLVQHALFKGTNTSGVNETGSEKSLSASPVHNSGGGVSPGAVLKSPALQNDAPAGSAPPPATEPAISSLLTTFRKNVSSLRQQLHQLRHMQLQSQDAMRLMLQQAEEELTERVCERLKLLDNPLQKQRIQVDEERHRYIAMEENVLLQLGELEKHVENLKKGSTSMTDQQPITLRDVEEGAVNLRKVGEALAVLKGEFPALQLKMRSVLRVEVEAVRFLKEEPHKMDSMLKRVKALTETLGCLRRCATEGHTDLISTKPEEPNSPNLPRDSPTPQPRSPARMAHSELTPSSPVLVQRARSAPVNLQPSQLSTALSHHASPPLTPTHGRDAPTVAKVSPRSREDSPALQKKAMPHVQDGVINSDSVSDAESATPPPQDEENAANAGRDETAEKKQVEAEAGAQMERILQQAQANLMKAIPDLEVTTQEDSSTTNPPTTVTLPDEVDCPQPPAPPPEATAPAEPVVEKPVHTSVERLQKPPVEKPHRASVERAKPSAETAGKSPPPPPPRRFYPQGTGLTTGRSGEVIYTSRKEATPAQQQEVEEGAMQPKPQRVPPEVKPKPHTPPPVCASTARDEEDDDEDKIIAELQVFEKCPVKDLEPRYVVDLTTHELPDPEAAFSLSSYDPKNTAQHCEDGKHTPDASSGSGVIYYITGTAKIPSNNLPREPEVQKESGEEIMSSSKVANPNTSDFSQRPNILTPYDLTLDPPKSVEEGQAESISTQQTSVSLLKPLKDTCKAEDDAAVQKGQSAESRTKRPEKLVSTAENLTVTGKFSSVGSEVQATDSLVVSETSVLSKENGGQENEQQVLMRQSRSWNRIEEDASLSPDLPGEEAPPPPPPDNIAFMITKTKVKALSNGEYQQLVSSKGQDVETVKVGTDTTASAPEDGGFCKKPVIIVFDEPMDIRQAYKRLSTIFECEEELDKMLSEEPIEEEAEEVEEESHLQRQVMTKTGVAEESGPEGKVDGRGNPLARLGQEQNPTECSSLELEDGSKTDVPGDAKQEAKKKFKFKFPKKQLAAIGQALRTGTKTGKKTLQVVVYEDEEEPDGTLRQAREAKRFEIKSQTNSSSPVISDSTTLQTNTISPVSSKGRTNDICKTTYKTLDSLEETIKQLETTISDMDPALSPETSRKESKAKRTASQTAQGEASPSKRPTPQVPKPQKSPQRKKVKAQSSSRSSSSSSSSSGSGGTKQNTSGSPSLSRVSSPRSRQQAGSSDKSGKPQKIQDSQRQFRQANGSTARGSSKYAFLALPASKIPAFCRSSGKSSAASTSVSNASKPTNHLSPCSKSSVPSLSLNRPGHSPSPPSNESLRVPGPSQRVRGYDLSLSAQTHGTLSSYYSSSSSSSSHSSSSSVSPTSTSSSSSPSSPSLLSPTAVSRASRAPHVLGFSSPRLQPGTTSRHPTVTPASTSKDMP